MRRCTHKHVARPVYMVHVPPLSQYPSVQTSTPGSRRNGYAVVVDSRVMNVGARRVGVAPRSFNSTTHTETTYEVLRPITRYKIDRFGEVLLSLYLGLVLKNS